MKPDLSATQDAMETLCNLIPSPEDYPAGEAYYGGATIALVLTRAIVHVAAPYGPPPVNIFLKSDLLERKLMHHGYCFNHHSTELLIGEPPEDRPITILDVVREKLGNRDVYTGADFEKLGLPMMAGCQCCGATLGAWNSCPSRTGFIQCRDCIHDYLGFYTVKAFDNWKED